VIFNTRVVLVGWLPCRDGAMI